MTCKPDSLQCSIDDLGRTLTSFNVNDLLATAIATVVGVVVGAILASLISRREERRARTLRDEEATERQQSRLNRALERVIWEIHDHAVQLRKTWERQQAPEPTPEWRSPDYGVLAGVAAARMIATTDDDKAVLDEIRELTLAVRNVNVPQGVTALTGVWRVLILWQGGQTRDEVLKSLGQLRADALAPTESTS